MQSLHPSDSSRQKGSDKLDFTIAEEVKDHYFSIELLEPGVTELSCLTKNFLYRWHELHPKTLFHLYVVGHDILTVPETLPNLRLHELDSSLIKQTPLGWWLDAHVYWKYQTAMRTTIKFDQLDVAYNPSDHPIPMFQHLTLIYSIVLLRCYGGTYISTNIALIKPITSITSTANVTLVQRSNNRVGLDFLSIMTVQRDLIQLFLIGLSDAYRNQDIMTIDAELILSEILEFPSTAKNSFQLLPESTFYQFNKETMFSNWYTTKDSLAMWESWQADTHVYGVHFPIVRVPRDVPAPINNSLIHRLTSLPDNLSSSKQVSCFHASIDRIHMGQLVYQDILTGGNNGDYVQAWASLQYYPCVDRFFDRDNMRNLPHMSRMKLGQSAFKNDPLTPVSILMNAFWAHFPTEASLRNSWPPPDYFRPVYVSMHIQKLARLPMGSNTKTFVKYGPVGARDMATLQFLRESNITSWFSGCLTTTLKVQSIDRVENNNNNNIKHPILIIDVSEKLLATLVPPHILRDDVRYESAVYRPIDINEIYEQMNDFNRVRKRLQGFLNSRLVITSRLHVLLPCLALGVPAIFVYPSGAFKKDERFQGLVNILVDHVYSEKDRFFWKNRTHPHFIDWENPTLTDKPKKQALSRIISGLHQRLKQEKEFRVWGRFYQVFD